MYKIFQNYDDFYPFIYFFYKKYKYKYPLIRNLRTNERQQEGNAGLLLVRFYKG